MTTKCNDNDKPQQPAPAPISYAQFQEPPKPKEWHTMPKIFLSDYVIVGQYDDCGTLRYTVSGAQTEAKTTEFTKDELQQLGNKKVYTTNLFVTPGKNFRAMELGEKSIIEVNETKIMLKVIYNFGADGVSDIAPYTIFTLDKPAKVTETFVRVTNNPLNIAPQ